MGEPALATVSTLSVVHLQERLENAASQPLLRVCAMWGVKLHSIADHVLNFYKPNRMPDGHIWQPALLLLCRDIPGLVPVAVSLPRPATQPPCIQVVVPWRGAALGRPVQMI